jgi:type VI secretion system Hcp family effector
MRSLTVSLALAAVTLLSSPAFAGLDACILIKQGGKEFEGSSKKTGHLKNSSIVHAVYHSITTPVDHGAVTGRRQHGVMQVDMLIDPSIYQLYNAIIDKDKSGAKKLEVTLQFYRTNQDNIGLWGGGENAPYYKIVLSEAVITSIEFIMNDLTPAPGTPPGAAAAQRTGELVRVKFAYDKIEWTFMQGNKNTLDSWNATH